MNYPKSLLVELYQDTNFSNYLNEENFNEQFPNLCKEAKLNDHYIEVLQLRYKDNMTMQAIGDIFNCTRENIRQVLVKAINKLQAVMDKYINENVYYDSLISELVLSERSINILNSYKINTIRDFINADINENTLKKKGAGIFYINEIMNAKLRVKYIVKDKDLIVSDVKQFLESHGLTKNDLIDILNKNI